MKKLTILTLLMIFAIAAFAQTPQKHEKRTYIGPDGKYYYNKALPAYLYISTSPDGSDKHKLESSSTAEYANPLYFDTEGINTIRTPYCVDPETKKVIYKDVVFEVYADGLAPNSSHNFSSAPKYYKGGTTYFGKGLTITVTSRDAVSGVNKTYYALNFGQRATNPFKDYGSTITLDTEGENTFKYYAADNVGNAEEPNTVNYTVDLSSPNTSYAISGPQLGDIISPKCKITLTSTDNLSGVQKILYHWDDKSDSKYYSPVSFSYLSDGNHSLTYYAIDNVLNKEDAKRAVGNLAQSGNGSGIYKFYLDRIPPVPNAIIEGDQHKGKYQYVSPRTKIKLTATDNKAGVKSITYLIDYTGQTDYSSPFPVTNKKGLHYINYFATDKVENVSSKKLLTVYMDNVNPTTAISYGSPKFFDRDTLFINKETNVTLTAKDYESGVQRTEYTIDNTQKTTYNAPFTIPNEGYRKIEFNSTDNVNNVEQMKESNVYVDNTPPVIYINFSIKPIDSKSKDGKKYDVFPNYTRLYVGATDKKSGTDQIQYSLNGAAFRDYSSPHTLDVSELSLFKTKKLYTVIVRAKDKLGNQSEKTVEFYVGKE